MCRHVWGVGEQDLPSPDFSSTAQPMGEAGQAAVYQGGFYMDLHRMLGVQSGSEVRPLPQTVTPS